MKYAQDVEMATLFLNGNGSSLLSKISQKMKQASIDLDFEAAANYRDQLIGLRTRQERHGSQFSSDIKAKEETLIKQKNELKQWKEKYNSLKIANTFLGSNDKSLTKLKINNLIKELDKCILSLSS